MQTAEQRFRCLERRALFELGVPTALLGAAFVFQTFLGLVTHRRFAAFGLDLWIYNAVLAAGCAAVWLLAYLWTETEIVLSPAGLRLEIFRLPQWTLSWEELAAWTWDWHWTGVPQGILFMPKGYGRPKRIRLGFLGLGRRVGKMVVAYRPYAPLLNALGYYLPGEPWEEAPSKKAFLF